MIRVVDAAGNLLAGPDDKRVRDTIEYFGGSEEPVMAWTLSEFCPVTHRHEWVDDYVWCRTCGNRVERISPP